MPQLTSTTGAKAVENSITVRREMETNGSTEMVSFKSVIPPALMDVSMDTHAVPIVQPTCHSAIYVPTLSVTPAGPTQPATIIPVAIRPPTPVLHVSATTIVASTEMKLLEDVGSSV